MQMVSIKRTFSDQSLYHGGNADSLHHVVNNAVDTNNKENSLKAIEEHCNRYKKKREDSAGHDDVDKVSATVDGETVVYGKYTPAVDQSIIMAKFPNGCVQGNITIGIIRQNYKATRD